MMFLGLNEAAPAAWVASEFGERLLAERMRVSKPLSQTGVADGRVEPSSREPRKLPVVLSADEVVQVLESVSSLKSRAAHRRSALGHPPRRG